MQSQRLLALDLFRGLTILFMIMVNSPNTYGEFSHAYWDGVTFADFIFPFFLIIVGVAVAIGLQPVARTAEQLSAARVKILRRTLILFGLGIFVNLIYLKFAELRILGVLQRIALVYLVCSLLSMHCRTKRLVQITVFILLSYWLLILLVPAPGLPAGQLQRDANLINWFDSQFLPGMLWRGSWDPEGILSTYPAIASGLFGVIMGRLVLLHKQQLPTLVMLLFVLGFSSFLLGCLWSLWFPLIKQIWSSSFVLVTSGMASMVLALLIWYTDVQQYRKFSHISLVFGANAIVAYVLHVALEKLLELQIAGVSVHGSYLQLAEQLGLSRFFSAGLWILAFLALCYVPVWWMYQRKIFVKI
ncbi:acyltransferase family protein [Rheinheimera hassiensis]|uniref:acyltransferase family protein n=1 Tax=Rheinheimera hassiensis TaxID=1193627 RepID=UPI001F061444|nr:heparan-alpha-glucosaminide N-acetyltransferase domain-containing protein [Rheinheimera hassiensis]